MIAPYPNDTLITIYARGSDYWNRLNAFGDVKEAQGPKFDDHLSNGCHSGFSEK